MRSTSRMVLLSLATACAPTAVAEGVSATSKETFALPPGPSATGTAKSSPQRPGLSKVSRVV